MRPSIDQARRAKLLEVALGEYGDMASAVLASDAALADYPTPAGPGTYRASDKTTVEILPWMDPLQGEFVLRVLDDRLEELAKELTPVVEMAMRTRGFTLRPADGYR